MAWNGGGMIDKHRSSRNRIVSAIVSPRSNRVREREQDLARTTQTVGETEAELGIANDRKLAKLSRRRLTGGSRPAVAAAREAQEHLPRKRQVLDSGAV